MSRESGRRTFNMCWLGLLATSLACSPGDRGDYRLRVVDYGGRECAYGIVETALGDFVVTGSGPGLGPLDENVYVARLSGSGEVIGQTSYGGEKQDIGRAVAATPDGGYIIAGSTSSIGAGLSDVFLLRLDAGGDSVWARTYGGPVADGGWAVAVAADSGFFIAGTTGSFGHGRQDVYVLRTDVRGDTVWTRCFGGTEDDGAKAVVATTDGGCLVVGSTTSFGAGNSDVFVVKCGPNGDSLWAEAYGSVDYEEGNCVVPTLDRGYVIAGSSHFDAPAGDLLLMKVNPNGVLVWEKRYGSYQGDCGYGMANTLDGGYVITGYYTTPGQPGHPISSNAYLVKVDDTGNLEWQQDFGGVNQECGYGVVATADGAYVLAGGTYPPNHTSADILWIKALAPSGKQ